MFTSFAFNHDNSSAFTHNSSSDEIPCKMFHDVDSVGSDDDLESPNTTPNPKFFDTKSPHPKSLNPQKDKENLFNNVARRPSKVIQVIILLFVYYYYSLSIFS